MHINDHNALEKYVYDNVKFILSHPFVIVALLYFFQIQASTIGFFPLRGAKVLDGKVDAASVWSL